MAGQCEIVEVIGAAARLWDDVFYLKRKVEDRLRRMSVLTTVHRVFGNSRVQRGHGWTDVRPTFPRISW